MKLRYLLTVPAVLLSLAAPAQEGGLDKLLGDVLSGIGGTPPAPQQGEAQRRVWSEPQVAQTVAKSTSIPRYDALLVQTSNGALILYPFGGKRFLDGKIAAQQWDSRATLMADWNLDGAADLLVLGGDGKLWLRLQLNGALQAAQAVDGARGGFSHIFSGDFDGDGNLELVARQDNGEMFLYSIKFGAFQPARKIGSDWHFSHYWVKDWDGDGSSDFLVRSETGDLILYPVRNGAFQTGRQVGRDWRFTDYFAEDWNGDNSPDMLVRTAGGELILYPFRALGGFEPGRVVARDWRFSHAFPGEWAGQLAMLARDHDGGMFLSPFRLPEGFAPPEQVGNDWHFQNYIPFRSR
jgi:hypothetical protein